MSQAISGVGTIFRKWTGSAWATISEITQINGPQMSRETIDVTNLDSDSGYREFIASFRDGGTINATMNFTRAGLDLMKADFDVDTVQYYEVVLPDTAQTSLEFQGFVTELPLSISPDSQITMDVTIKITGPVTVNDGASSGLTP
jgi:predicted secreted protein